MKETKGNNWYKQKAEQIRSEVRELRLLHPSTKLEQQVQDIVEKSIWYGEAFDYSIRRMKSRSWKEVEQFEGILKMVS